MGSASTSTSTATARIPLFSFVFIVLVFFFYLRLPQSTTRLPVVAIEQNYTLHLTELGGSHEEVVAALVHAFGSEPHAKLTIYQLLARYGIAGLMQKFDLPHQLPKSLPPNRFMDNTYDKALQTTTGEGIDILVATTCEIDVENNSGKLRRLLQEENTHLFCIVHHAERWAKTLYENSLSQWIEKERVTFVALSPHTQDFLRDHSLAKWDIVKEQGKTPVIEYLAPVYPVELPTVEESVKKQGDSISFSIQGDYSSGRRDYNRIFGELGQILGHMGSVEASVSQPHNLTLKLLGHGNRPVVPQALKHNVQFGENLGYQKYYTMLAESFAVVPAFATREYYDRKASSSVPAALIAGVPIIADQLMLDTYQYLTKDVVWFQEENEDDMDVLNRAALAATTKERVIKKHAVRQLTSALIKENQQKVAYWVGSALKAAAQRKEVVVPVKVPTKVTNKI